MPVQRNLERLRQLLDGGDESCLDDLYQAFQEADHKDRGYLKDANALSMVLRGFFPSNELKHIDMGKIADQFPTRNNHFDYTAFCQALRDQPSGTGEIPNGIGGQYQSPTKRTRPLTRLTSPGKRIQRTKAKYRSGLGLVEPAPIDRKMRVDKRLEAQRLLTESVRVKLLRGIVGSKGDGFSGLQNTLRRLDNTGDGYLDARVFMKRFVSHLKEPLTRPECQFLLSQLRAQNSQNPDIVDYEQIGRICGIDSDNSLSGCDSDLDDDGNPSSAKSSQLGAEYLLSEKRLRDFLQAPMEIAPSGRAIEASGAVLETPRSVFTGAERFLEVAETIDSGKTGFLHEDDFTRVLCKCGINIPPALLRGMLSRLTRSSDGLINYSAFLMCYGQNPQHSRERRQLKRLILCFLSRIKVSGVDWLRFLRERFEKYDIKVHGSKQGTLPSEVQGRSAVLKLTTDEAAQVTSLLLRISDTSSPTRIQYHELLRFVDECHQADRYRWREMIASTETSNTKLAPLEMATPTKTLDSAVVDTPQAPSCPASSLVQSESSGTVGDYLMFHATEQERQNFESLMDVLNAYQASLQLPQQAEGDDTRVIHPVADGITMALGPKLRVQIQFRM